MRNFGCLWSFVFGICHLAQADILARHEMLSFKEDISKWNYSLTVKVLENPQLKKTGLMECGELKELKGVVLCASTKKTYMNKALTRASIFSEGSNGTPVGSLASTDSAVYQNIVTHALGHDIPSKALLGFWSDLEHSCQEKRLCPTPEEKDLFQEIILPVSHKESQFVVISYSIDTEWYVTLSHEMMHAQYFLDPTYQKTVDQFWSETVTAAARKEITEILAAQYNKEDEFVIRNEFQAFILQHSALQAQLHQYVPLYRDKLIQKLKEAGSEPLGL